MDLTKSLVITSSSPSRRTHRRTARRIVCNRRSSARRWGSVRTGRKGSPSRDSLITSLSWNSGWARSWSRSSVERFILRREWRRRNTTYFVSEFILIHRNKSCILLTCSTDSVGPGWTSHLERASQT